MQKLNFHKFLVVLTVVCGLIILAFQNLQTKWELDPLVWLTLFYFFALTWVTYKIANSGVNKDNKTFISRIYGAIGIRFIFSVFPLFIYLLFYPKRELPFIVSYLLLYFFYTAFEIYFLVVNLRPDLNKKNPS
jgi:drug/metabolite transporter (DMT)-like permease